MTKDPVDDEKNFHHPYTPYAIQKEFMKVVYRCAEEGKVGILESPTGTGKSLSLICGSLTWLRDHKRKAFVDDVNGREDDDNDDEPDWMLASLRAQRHRAKVQRRTDEESRLAKIRAKENAARVRYESGEPPLKRQRIAASAISLDNEEEAAFLLDDYESDEDTKVASKANVTKHQALSAETQALLAQLGMDVAKPKHEEDAHIPDEVKIFYCSRTHSQITQFVNELRRIKLPSSIPPEISTSSHETDVMEELKHLTLASRKNLCINPKVSKLVTTNAINERCLELQQPGTSVDSKCLYLPKRDGEVLMNDFRDHAMAKIRDIEDFGKLGRKIGICPYYASRAAINPSEIVTLPYPLLLQKSTREALNISLKNHVVIIDEAHNLLDAIANMHSVSISLAHLHLARAQLTGYLQKFRNRLKGKNRVYVTQLVRLLDSLIAYLQSKLTTGSPTDGRAQIGDLMAGKGVDQVNLYKLMHYLQESKLARKVERYALFEHEHKVDFTATAADQSNVGKTTTLLPVLSNVHSFLLALTYPTAEGQFFFARANDDLGGEDILLKYQLLDPTFHFREVVEEARAVILVGGTMSPMTDYTNHLFHYLAPERIETLSCGHVIPTSNLLALSIARAPDGTEFDFTFGKRHAEKTLLQLGYTIVQFAGAIPDGLVVFFPSYAYLNSVVQSWQKLRQGQPETSSLWHRLSQHKRIFIEPKSTSNATSSMLPEMRQHDKTETSVDKVLAAYTEHINSGKGALLLAVIGGSLSEGINFSDRLGRGVVVVGLPFPNAQSAEWKAKMEFIEQRSSKNGSGNTGVEAAREFYENACMRAVNQSVGRAIRHKDDYAAILLLDRRYETTRINGKLPGWIRNSFRSGTDFERVLGSLKQFYKDKMRT